MQSKDLQIVLGDSPTGISFAQEAEVLRGDGKAGHLKNLFPFSIFSLVDGYLHDSALHTNAHNWYPYHIAPQNQMEPTTPVAIHTSAHVLSGYDRENLNSQGILRIDTRDQHNGLQSNYAQRSQNNVFPPVDFGSEQPLLLNPSQTAENGVYIDKGQSSHEATGILGGPTHLVATHLPNAIVPWPWNSQMHQNNFLVHPKKLGDFVDPQGGVNVPALSSHNGHSFNVNCQLPQNVEAAVHAVGSKETTGMSKLEQDSGTQSMQNTHNFQPVATRDDNTHLVAFSHSVEMTGHAAAQKTFKSKLTNFVKDQLKRTWHSGQGHLTRELYKVIAQEVVEKLICSEENILDTSQETKNYLRRYKEKNHQTDKELNVLSLDCVLCRSIVTGTMSNLLTDMEMSACVLPGSKRLKRLIYLRSEVLGFVTLALG
ncbi:hypothetical protein BAE44_0014274 [Dichanthelium oligosanthes]|uniref:Uncharacterized protein n=1 Tax=Dichanthelium oligosanthes TaxID=888268 RepID=A0A1E5VHX0_9POAL|nr:hypothetical protein BAE44_0014274 [Dichanthelium oligosanthes]